MADETSDETSEEISVDMPSIGAMLQRTYKELRALAAHKLARMAPGQTLGPTSLVHEVYTRLMNKREVNYADDREFFIIAACSMRDVLVEQARKRASLKAGGNRKRVPLEDVGMATDADDLTLLDIDALVRRVKDEDETDYKLLMLRFYAGLTEPQAAEALGMSLRTMQRRWQFIRARMYDWMTTDSLPT